MAAEQLLVKLVKLFCFILTIDYVFIPHLRYKTIYVKLHSFMCDCKCVLLSACIFQILHINITAVENRYFD